jgi:hypothetical protein
MRPKEKAIELHSKKMFLVEVTSWYYCNRILFVTKSKEIAANWTTRFNRLIEEQAKKIEEGGWMEKYLHDKPTPFWFEYITYESPKAYYREVEGRGC